jgi:hypothetical protein
MRPSQCRMKCRPQRTVAVLDAGVAKAATRASRDADSRRVGYLEARVRPRQEAGRAVDDACERSRDESATARQLRARGKCRQKVVMSGRTALRLPAGRE